VQARHKVALFLKQTPSKEVTPLHLKPVMDGLLLISNTSSNCPSYCLGVGYLDSF
jgi:hypothetical protein